MFLYGNITFQFGCSGEIGKMFNDIGKSPLTDDNSDKLLCTMKEKGKFSIFPIHETNYIFSLNRKEDCISHELLKENSVYFQDHHNLNVCFVDSEKIKSIQNTSSVFLLGKKTQNSYGSIIKDNSIIVFQNHEDLSTLSTSLKKKFHFLNQKAYKRYCTLINNLDFLKILAAKVGTYEIDYKEKKITGKYLNTPKEFGNYLASNFFLLNSIVLMISLDSVGKSKELGNFFLPIKYESVYIMFEISMFARILKYNATILDSKSLIKMYRKYFLIKFGISTDLMGLAFTTDVKGIIDSINHILSVKHQIIALLKCLVRSISLSKQQKRSILYFTFDFFTFSFSIGIFFFPIKYAAYIDQHGKKDGVQLISRDSSQTTYY